MPIISMLCALGILAFQHIENKQQDNSIKLEPRVQNIESITSPECESCPLAEDNIEIETPTEISVQ